MTSAMHIESGQPKHGTQPVMWLARIGLLGWAGFWLYFTLAHTFGGNPADVAPSLFVAIPILAITILALLRPRIGGVFLMLAAIFAAWYFDGAVARLAFALPPGLIGILMFAIAKSKPSEPRAHARGSDRVS